MRTIGIIGGLGPEATIDYYKEIIQRFNTLNPNGNLNYPEIVIYSVNIGKLIGHMEVQEYDKAVDYLSSSIHKLEAAGADFGAISANTPHLLFKEIQQRCKLPLISIVETAKEESSRLGLKKVGLIGTKFTMKNSFYSDAFAPSGIEIIVPRPDEIETINQKLFSELELGIYKDETKELFLEIINTMKERDKIDSLILGCTEFPIMFTESHYMNIPFLNTTSLHVNKIVAACLA